MTIVTFNVGGKLYKINEGTIFNSRFYNEIELLPMLIRQKRKTTNKDESEELEEIFIDRDHKIFRWILYVYRYDYIPSHSHVGISKTMWDKELGKQFHFKLPKERSYVFF